MMKTALITGITGQDGSYLAELLLEKGYEIHGIIRRSSSFNTGRIDHIFERLHLHFGDLCDGSSLRHILAQCRPNEVYNLAAQSHVKVSFDQPEYTADVVGTGTLRLLEAVRDVCPDARFYQASSSEMFGNAGGTEPIDESTPFAPCSPYACAKVFAHQTAKMYRDAYGMFVACGIMFNHESPRRGETFVTRKVCKAAARIKYGLQDEVVLGNLQAKRDWGYAPQYVTAMWRMLQEDRPDDFVIGTGYACSVGELVELAFDYAEIERGKHVRLDARYERPADVNCLLANPSKARAKGIIAVPIWVDVVVRIMVDAELVEAEKEKRERDYHHRLHGKRTVPRALQAGDSEHAGVRP